MRRRNLDLVAAIAIAAASIPLALLPDRLPLAGTLLALPLVFLLPGYTLTQALFRPRPTDSSANSTSSPGSLILPPRLLTGYSFGAFDHLAFSLGLSLVIDILVGFLLNLLPIGLQWQSWSLTLGLLALVFALVALIRRLLRKHANPSNVRRDRGQSGGVAGALRLSSSHSSSSKASHGLHPGQAQGPRTASPYPLSLRVKEGTLLLAALIIAGLAMWLAIIRPPQPQPSFTQFWMLPSTQANHSCAVQVGIQSFETAPVAYRVQVTDGSTQVFLLPSIALDTQQQWKQVVFISNAGTGNSQLVDAHLYRLDHPGTTYREVHLTLHDC